MLSCDEAATVCDKNQYGEASFWDKFKLQIHLLTCKICRKYVKQNSLLTKAFNKKAKDSKKIHICMNDADKEKLKKELEKLSA